MYRIILCEGKTDIGLLSYLLLKVYNWTETKEEKAIFPIRARNEEINFYKKGSDILYLWATGSINNIPLKLKEIIDNNKIVSISKIVENIVIVFDMDNKTNEQKENNPEILCQKWINEATIKNIKDIKFQEWNLGKYKHDIYPKEFDINILPIVIPPNEMGALERFIIDELKNNENEVNKEIFPKVETLINELKTAKVSYLEKDKYYYKSQLGCILAIMFPDWILKKLSEKLNNIQWEKFNNICDIFKGFKDL